MTLSPFEIYQPVKAHLLQALNTFHKKGIHGGPCHHLSFNAAPPLKLSAWVKNNHGKEKYDNRIE